MVSEEPAIRLEFEGKATIGESYRFARDFSTLLDELVRSGQNVAGPAGFAAFISKIYETLSKSLESQSASDKVWVASVEFRDGFNTPVHVSLDLGDKIPMLSSNVVRAKIIIELYDEEPRSDSTEQGAGPQ